MTWLIPTIVLSLVLILVLVGMAMTAITLPGIWTMAAGALLLLVGFPEYIGWWTVGAIFGIAAFSELVDFVASALGVKRMGGSKSGAVGSVIGTLVGAIGGTFVIPIPIAGSIIGGVVGAGLGAFLAERSVAQRTIKDSFRSGSGAAAGRLVSMVIKLMLAGTASAVLVTMVVFNMFFREGEAVEVVLAVEPIRAVHTVQADQIMEVLGTLASMPICW